MIAQSFIRLLILGILSIPFSQSAEAQQRTLASFRVLETLNEPRGLWPVVVGVLVPLAPTETDRIGLRELTETGVHSVAFQRLDVRSASIPRSGRGPRRSEHESLLELVFFVALQPGDKRHYQVVYEGPNDQPAATPLLPALEYDGNEPGIRIRTGPVSFAFHPASGQLLHYTPHLAGWETPLGFIQDSTNAIHHNPDIWSPPHPWGHTSGWDIARDDRAYTWKSARGPLAWRFTRSGSMPPVNRVKTDVSYTVFAGMPFILVSSTMRFPEDTRVNAVRSSELVFNRGIHTHAAFMEPNGQITALPAYDPENPRRIFGRLGLPPLSPDIPWMALFHRDHGYGIAVVSLERSSVAPGSLTLPQTVGAHYYFNDFGQHPERRFDWNFLYICRAEILHPTIVPQGSVFSDRAAFLAFATDHDQTEAGELTSLHQWALRLRQPPRIEFDRRR